MLAANLDKVEEYRGGKDKLFGFFVGQVMKQSGGKANPRHGESNTCGKSWTGPSGWSA